MKRKILVVDDIQSNRDILRLMLEEEYRILEAGNGREAMDILNRDKQGISAVILDLMMPVMDGYEVLAHMGECAELSQIPVIIATANNDTLSEEKALSLGAKDYIAKPYKPVIIKQRIRNTIHLRETSAMANALKYDRLTGIYSREAFFDKVEKLVKKHEAGYYVMACFDVDKFKVVNDQYGTEKGDEVLKHIAATFKEGFEKCGGICCRIASDDFAAFYPAAFRNSEEIAEIRKKAGSFDGIVAPIAFCIGRYIVDDVTMSPSAMYDRAMLAAESVNGQYGAKIGTYDESMRSHLILEQQLVNEMENALAERQFEAWYQPQYNHSTGALIGAEALVRWRHPERGLIPPGIFIPVFEQNGFIYSLDKYVWEEVCRYLHDEIKNGQIPLPVSVNISRHDVFHQDFTDVIFALVEKYDIPVELLRLEITESAFAKSTKQIVEVVKILVDRGFTMEIDDFGSGYSSLNTLKDVPAQVVKLDMRFLEDSEDSDRGGNIVESVVRMTKWLGMSVIAEGVETKGQADFLKSIGCNYIQGYFYAKPMPEAEYRELCSEGKQEERLLTMETVENLDNNSFWNPNSMDTLIFSSYVGAASIFEYYQDKIDLLRTTEKYVQMISGTGMTIEDAVKINWSDYLDEKSQQEIYNTIHKSIETGKEVVGEYTFVDLPGCQHEVFLRSTMRVIASAGERYLVYCTNEDMTAQRQAEARENKLAEQMKAILENVDLGIVACIIRKESVEFILANNQYYEMLGYTKEQFEQEVANPYEPIIEEDRERVEKQSRAVVKSNDSYVVEYRAVRRDGSVIWLRTAISVGRFTGVDESVHVSIFRDITDEKAAEQQLIDAVEQMQNIMKDIPGGFCRMRLTADGGIKPVYINEGLCRLMGMTHDEVMDIYRNDGLAGVHSDDIGIVNLAIESMLANGEAQSSRYRLRHGSGGYIWLSIFGRVTKYETGDTYLNIYYTDATEQVKEEEKQKALLDNLPHGAALYEFDGESLDAIHLNKRYWELVNREPYKLDKDAAIRGAHPDDRRTIVRELKSAISQNRDFACDFRVRYGENGYRPFHVSGRIIAGADGKYSIYASYTPISEEAMSVQEMLPIALGAMMDKQTDYFFVKDKDLKYVCCSRPVADMVKYPSQIEMIGKCDHDFFEKRLADAFVADDRKVMKTGVSIIDGVDRLPSSDGLDNYACTSKFPLKDAHGNIVGIYGIGRDITDVRAMKSQFELLTNSVPCGIATYEYKAGKLSISYFNDGFCRLFEMTHDEYASICSNNVFAGIYDEDYIELQRQITSLIKNDTQIDHAYRVDLRSGNYKWINLKAVSVERSRDRVIFNAVLFDITERQEALERLRISEEENKIALEHASGIICRFDVTKRELRIHQKAQRIFSLPEIIKNVPFSSVENGNISLETSDAYQQFYEDIIEGRKNGRALFQLKVPLGWRWIEAQHSSTFSDDGRPVSAVISYTDVTEKMKYGYYPAEID